MAYGNYKSKIYEPLRHGSGQAGAEPWRISRSKIDMFIKCPRCFYLDQRLGIKQPDTYPLTLNIAVDALLKKEFDIHRAKHAAHPLMAQYGIDAVPLAHEKINAWRELDFGRGGIHFLHEGTNFDVYGLVDDVWVSPKGEFIIVDYKATAKATAPTLDGELGDQYRRQMEVYQWLFRKNDFKVSPTGYFVYVNGRKDAKAFDGKLEFDLSILPCEGDPAWVEPTLFKMKERLDSNQIPSIKEDCPYCRYIEGIRGALNKKAIERKGKTV